MTEIQLEREREILRQTEFIMNSPEFNAMNEDDKEFLTLQHMITMRFFKRSGNLIKVVNN